MEGVFRTIPGRLLQTLMSLRDFISRLDVQLLHEEPHGLVLIISGARERLAVISITRLLTLMLTTRGGGE